MSAAQNNRLTESLLRHPEALQRGFRQVGQHLIHPQGAAGDLSIAALLAAAALVACHSDSTASRTLRREMLEAWLGASPRLARIKPDTDDSWQLMVSLSTIIQRRCARDAALAAEIADFLVDADAVKVLCESIRCQPGAELSLLRRFHTDLLAPGYPVALYSPALCCRLLCPITQFIEAQRSLAPSPDRQQAIDDVTVLYALVRHRCGQPVTSVPLHRRVDVAAPAEATVDQVFDLLVQVSLPGAPPLTATAFPQQHRPDAIEQAEEPFALAFPVDAATGQVKATIVELRVIAPDCDPPEARRMIEAPVDRDSAQIFFLLRSKRAGPCHITVEVLRLDHITLGTIPVMVTISGGMVERRLQAASLTILVRPTFIDARDSRGFVNEPGGSVEQHYSDEIRVGNLINSSGVANCVDTHATIQMCDYVESKTVWDAAEGTFSAQQEAVGATLPAEQIEAALRAKLPPELHPQLHDLAQELAEVVAGERTPKQASTSLNRPEFAAAFRSLEGTKPIEAGGVKLEFGGDKITVGNIIDSKAVATGAGAVAQVFEINLLGRSVSSREQRNRRIMLDRVRTIAIKSMLEPSLYGGQLIDLHVEFRPSAVATPYRDKRLQRTKPEWWNLAAITKQCVSQSCGLLILGAPGGGKTTMLLALARALLELAESDPAEPIPFLVNLSTWARDRLSLRDWLVQELAKRYDVPRRRGAIWVDNDQVVPLLDGLDSVPATQRAACVETINAFRQEHGLIPLVVGCRRAEYELLVRHYHTRLQLNGALLIQPLNIEQIDSYLSNGGPDLAGLREDLQQDQELRALTETPLMLSLMVQVYEGQMVEHLRALTSLEARRRMLCATYVEQMLARSGADPRFPPAQTRRWLARLAAGMEQHGLNTFQLDQLQPDALITPTLLRQYTLLDRLGLGLLLSGPFGLFAGLVCYSTLPQVVEAFGSIPTKGKALGPVNLLVFLAAFLVIGGLFGGKSEQPPRMAQGLWWLTCDALQGWLLMAMVAGCVGGVGARLFSPPLEEILALSLAFALTTGLLGLIAGGLLGAPTMAPRRIAVVEMLRWAFVQPMRHIWASLGTGLFYGIAYVVGVSLVSDQTNLLNLGLLTGLVFALISAAVALLRSGLVSSDLETKVYPNQGTWRSARNAAFSGLITTACMTLIVGLGVGLLFILVNLDSERDFAAATTIGLGNGFAFGSIYGVGIGIIVGLAFGGYAFCSHFALRYVLWHNGFMPWRMVAFLDHCTERALLRRVGGGYVFIHRLLLEYIAGLNKGRKVDVCKAGELTEQGTDEPW
ncbi:NACHT domain-containing protein [Candidatus Chloroploca sp. M-50]|uniref:NACHT domain-containing protein n=1 Tax=Candidatus Chloroploca mongolica TaxID=2528176 RepID=A0ABS4DH12_9CHLR|nr:NACHT domain-containing protein [Candidatus Chloroploca mongolica]MBP1468718.1 NACHT domain-containing protein [Candidatus Chloroploca mongolica]